jgi:hypothetical protein
MEHSPLQASFFVSKEHFDQKSEDLNQNNRTSSFLCSSSSGVNTVSWPSSLLSVALPKILFSIFELSYEFRSFMDKMDKRGQIWWTSPQ